MNSELEQFSADPFCAPRTVERFRYNASSNRDTAALTQRGSASTSRVPYHSENLMRHVSDLIDDPSMCVVRIAQGERITGKLAELLNPVDPKTFHQYRLPANTDVELHFHEFDEYWWFTSGHPKIKLRAPNGVTRQFDLGPGDMIACVRGVEHTLWADHELVYYQYSSVLEGDERHGHLTR